jgi:response regulator RpfG family c-di-GMP phosphodiesterase
MASANIAVISKNEEFIKRGKVLGENFQSQVFDFADVDQFAKDETNAKTCQFTILDAVAPENPIAGLVQVARFVSQEANIIVVVDKKVQAEESNFIRKSGANGVLLENEFINQSKIEFIFALKTHGALIPIKAAELAPETVVDMTLHHLMPLNKKIIPFLPKGQILDKARHQKLFSVGEFYIKREEVNEFQSYIEKNRDKSNKGLQSRCRAMFLNMGVTFKNLVQLITDQSQAASYKEGKDLYDRTQELCQTLLNSLSAVGEAWDVINNSSFDDLSAVDRAPAIASYAGLMSLSSGIGKPEEVMISALIADIGLLDLSPAGIRCMQKNQIKEMTPTDREIYENHPIVSINKALARKLPVPDRVKKIIMGTHEHADGSGFPQKWPAEKILPESFLIHYAMKLDQSAMLEFGKERLNPQAQRQALYQQELAQAGKTFSQDFLQKINKGW